MLYFIFNLEVNVVIVIHNLKVDILPQSNNSMHYTNHRCIACQIKLKVKFHLQLEKFYSMIHYEFSIIKVKGR